MRVFPESTMQAQETRDIFEDVTTTLESLREETPDHLAARIINGLRQLERMAQRQGDLGDLRRTLDRLRDIDAVCHDAHMTTTKRIDDVQAEESRPCPFI